ncbi:MAG: PA2169 family four-helix-bundle protein [Candidatus Promineifilaceae bacterium]|nr:PA2169 family four-helix-bundle protein [Candidatus Promineifilaceae bacterium]
MPTMSDAQTAQILNELIQLNKDSAKGFKRAAAELRDVDAPDQADRLEALAEERAQMVDELQRAVADLGEAPETGGTGPGALKRGWLNIKAAMTIEHGKTKKVIVDDRLDQEEAVLEAYNDALENNLPDSIDTLLGDQRTAINEHRERLASIETTD